jgi:hypothetical protein
MFGIIFFIICAVIVYSIFGAFIGTLILVPAGFICIFLFGALDWLDDAFGRGKWEREEYRQDREDERLDRYLMNKKKETKHFKQNLNINVDARSIHLHNHTKEKENPMENYKSKYFGELIVNGNEECGSFDVKYNNHPINLLIGDFNTYGNKIKTCFNIIDKYYEITEDIKYTIRHSEEALSIIQSFFNNNVEINDFINQLQYPNINFELVDDLVHFWVRYNQIIFDKITMFTVEINENFEVIGYYIEDGFEKYDNAMEVHIDEIQEQIAQLIDTVIFPIFNRMERQLKNNGIECEQYRDTNDSIDSIYFHIIENDEELSLGFGFCYRGYNVKGRKIVFLTDDISGDGYYDFNEITNEFVSYNFNRFLSGCGIEFENKERKRGPIPEAVRHAVWRRDQGRCVICGSQEKLEFDHIIPFSKGGSDTERNLQLLCENCNRKKYNKI